MATVSDDGTVTSKKPGAVTVTVSRGSGTDQVSFSHRVDVTTVSLADAKVTIPRQTYSGKKLTPVPVVALNGTTLTADIDYEVVGQDIVNASFYDVVIQGKGIHEGNATGIFVVEPMHLTPPKPVTGLVYNGLPQTGVTEGDGYTLGGSVTETDADVFYAFATITDKTNTRWEDNNTSYRIKWSIKPRSISEASITGLGSYVYNGSAHKPKATVIWNGKTLKEEEADEDDEEDEEGDYTLSYAHNVNAGTATVTITCEEERNFEGTRTESFSITPAPIGGATVTLGEPLTYTGKAQTQKVASMRVGDVDVTEFCDISGNVATDVGDYELTVAAKPGGNYTGSITCPFSVARATYSVGTVTAAGVRDSLDSSDVVLTRSDTSLPGGLAITDSELSYGTNTYHWEFTPDDANYEPSSGTLEVTVTGHEWGAPTYEWSEDDASCTARRDCANNPEHVEEETAIPVRKVTVEPTAEVEGKATLTAEFENAAFETQSKEVTLPKLSGPDQDSSPGQPEAPSQGGSSSQTGSSSSSSTTSSSADTKSGTTRLANTSDNSWPIVPTGFAVMTFFALAMHRITYPIMTRKY